jgi:hypothetical protein
VELAQPLTRCNGLGSAPASFLSRQSLANPRIQRADWLDRAGRSHDSTIVQRPGEAVTASAANWAQQDHDVRDLYVPAQADRGAFQNYFSELVWTVRANVLVSAVTRYAP